MDTGINASKRVILEAAKSIGKYLGNKIADAVTKSNDDNTMKAEPGIDGNLRNVEVIIIPPEKREDILNELRQVL